MSLVTMTRELAFAASLDAGNRAMKAAGRTAWNKSDQMVAVGEFNRLWPPCEHGIDREEWCPNCDETISPCG